MARRNVDVEPLVAAMKHAGAALRDAEIRFALAGGLAIWARGGAVTDHDVDFLVKPEDAEHALQVLTDAGMRPERPPEDWLLKAYDGEVLVDLIHHPAGHPVTRATLERADVLEVDSLRMPVLSITDVMISKLHALSEQHCYFRAVLQIARSLREQVDWTLLRRETAGSPFASAFFVLVQELGILDPKPQLQLAEATAT